MIDFSKLYPDWFSDMSLSTEEKIERMKEESSKEYDLSEYVKEMININKCNNYGL